MKIREFQKRLMKLSGKSKDNFIRNELNLTGQKLLKRVRRRPRHPVKTGQLRASWKINRARKHGDHWELLLWTDCEYATYVEYGHRLRDGGWYPGRFMATTAIAKTKAELPKELAVDFVLWFEKEMGND